MKRVKVRYAEEKDRKQFGEWLFANRDLNHFDPDTFSYPSTRLLAAEDRAGEVLYLPYALAIMTDSLAPKPGASKIAKALALRECIYHLIAVAEEAGVGEIYFVAMDDETKEFAISQGYEEIKSGSLMRLKVHKAKQYGDRPQ